MNLLSAIVLSFALEAGVTDGLLVQYEPTFATPIDYPLYATVEVGAELGPLYAGGAVRTDMWMQKWNNYSPFQMTYSVSAGLRLDKVTLGWEHTCFHPIIPYAPILSRRAIRPSFEGAMDTLFVRISGRTK